MVLDDTQHYPEANYACQPGPGNLWAQCRTPRLHARRTEVLLVGTALRTVLTEENISRVLAVANDTQPYENAREHSLTRKDVQELWENQESMVLAAGRTLESRDFLGKIVAEIQVYTKTAIICYALPLPGDSPTGGHAPAGDRPAGRRRSPERDGGAAQETKGCLQSQLGSVPGDGTKKTTSAFRCHQTYNRSRQAL